MPFARGVHGTSIHYDVHAPPAQDAATGGRAVPVVLIQGLGLSSRFWFDLPQRLASDPRSPRTVITLDNRGTGRSGRPTGPYRMRDLADDVAAVMDAAGEPTAVVVGISLGGMVAQHVALRHPARVAGLVLLATTPGLPLGALPPLASLATLVSLPFRRGNSASALVHLLISPAHHARARELLAHWPAALAVEPVGAAPFLSQLAAATFHSTGHALHRIQCPTVVVTGADDVLIPPVNARRLADRIPRAWLEVLPDVGHAIPTQDPDVIARALARLAPPVSPAG